MFVRGADLDQGDVQSDFMIFKYFRDLGQVDRDIINFSFKSRLAHENRDKKQFDGKPGEKIFIVDIIGQGGREHLIDNNVLDGQIFDHGLDQTLGFSTAGSDKHPAAVVDFFNAFFRGKQFVRAGFP